jgi:catechol 2,3-dioxygenase-like lactoylglutathione lyase family enzyme
MNLRKFLTELHPRLASKCTESRLQGYREAGLQRDPRSWGYGRDCAKSSCARPAGNSSRGPEICEGYSPGYYAFFFEDPDGNKLEICCREKPVFAS